MFELTADPIDFLQMRSRLTRADAGALVCFEGLVRNHNEGMHVQALEYEVFSELAYHEAEVILKEAHEKFDIYDVHCTHRHGLLQIGDMAVLVMATSAHRAQSFLACQYVIDEVKHRLPIWKKEHYVHGPSQWVACQACAHHD